ncbi:MAG: HAD family hydrolase [Lachnospiraceae bacterium]|nr:HAD family hydrolase [Lachnospiraceae bacterium]
MYQNYIFDLYGTLADIRTDEDKPYLWKKLAEIYASFGAFYSPAELKREFRLLEQKEKTALGGKDAEPDLRKVFAALYRHKEIACDDAQARMTAIFFRTISREKLTLYDGAEVFLKELKRRGKGVYLLSNAQADFTEPELSMLGLTPYFDGIFLSSRQGVKKPSPAFFNGLLKQYGLIKRESIMIGNDEASDIAGACAVGMDSLYIHTDISPKEYGVYSATYRIMDGDFKKIAPLLL